MRAADTSLWSVDVAVGYAFSLTEEFERLANDPLAMDLFLAVGQTHLRGPTFYEDCFTLSARLREQPFRCRACGHPHTIETSADLLAVLRTVQDGALRDPWKPMSRIGYGWSMPPTDAAIRAEEIARELRLRELVECVKGYRHVKWHVMPPPPPPEPILFYEI